MNSIIIQPEVIEKLADCVVDVIQNKIDWSSIDWQAVAENATSEKLKGEWIPVRERLPEEGEKVLVWFEYYRYGDYNRKYQTYGFCYQYDGKWSTFINGETGWQDARIIAWQPLPEPYKEAENDNN